MSCYQVSSRHINALVQFAKDHDLLSGMTAQDAGEMLWQANARSVAARYNEEPQTEGYVHHGYCAWSVLQSNGMVKVLKAVNGFEYQSYDAPCYEGSPAQKLLSRIKSAAIYLLPGYSDADWSID